MTATDDETAALIDLVIDADDASEIALPDTPETLDSPEALDATETPDTSEMIGAPAMPDTPEVPDDDAGEADDSQLVSLAAETTGEEARRFAERLLEHRFNDLVIEAGEVQRIDTPCLEVLISTARRWSADGRRIEYRNGSQAFRQCLEALGLSLSFFEVVENA